MGIQLLPSPVPLEASISFNTTGDTSVIAGTAGKQIVVVKLWLVISVATNITPSNGNSGQSQVAFSGALPFLADGSIMFNWDGMAYFTCGTGNDFVLNQSGTAQVSGRIYYYLQ